MLSVPDESYGKDVMCTTLISMLFLGTPVSSTSEPDHQHIAVGNHYITNQCLLKIALFFLRNIAYNFILHLTDHCQWDASGSDFYIQDYLYVQNKNKVNNISQVTVDLSIDLLPVVNWNFRKCCLPGVNIMNSCFSCSSIKVIKDP